MKFTISDRQCRTVTADLPGVDKELRTQAIARAGKAKAAAQGFKKSGAFKGSIVVEKHRRGYSVDINDPAAMSIIYGHENSGSYEDVPGRATDHREVIDAIMA